MTFTQQPRPCEPWATPEDLCVPCVGYSISEDIVEAKIQEASEVLYQLSSQQFPGSCERIIQPCSRRYAWNSDWQPWNGIVNAPLRFGLWPICGCSGSWDACSCNWVSIIPLPDDQVSEINEITLDGVVVNPLLYELRSDNVIARTDGEAWPCCTEDFRISYQHGIAPPNIGVTAAAVLACELLIGCYPEDFPDAKCRLPKNISAVSRQGVSVIFQSLTRSSPTQAFRFGIWEIDLFLEAFAPNGSAPQSIVMSVDTMDLGRVVN